MSFRRKQQKILLLVLGLLLLGSKFVGLAQIERPGIFRVAAAGNWYAAAYLDRTTRIWDVNTQQPLFTIVDTTQVDFQDEVVYRIIDLDFSPDGDLLAAGFGGANLLPGSVRIFDTATGNMVRELDAWSSSGDIAWKPDGTQLAVLAMSGGGSRIFVHLMIWDAVTGNLITDQDLGEAASGIAIDWSPDGSQLATFDGPKMYLWNTTSWSRELNVAFPTGVTDIAWSPDGSQLAGVDIQGTVYVVDISTAEIVRTLLGTSSDEYPRKVAWNADNKIAATNTNQILVWDATTGNLLSTVEASNVIDVAWLPDNRLLYGGSDTLTEPEIVTLSSATPTPTPTETSTPTPTATFTPTPTPTPTIVEVKPLSLQGWTFSTVGIPPVYSFILGPSTPPRGLGSLSVLIALPASKLIMRPPMTNITSVASLLPLSYSTYRSTSLASQFYVNLYLDTDGNPATCETRLDFAPTSGTINTWETWNAGAGIWRQKSGSCFGGGTFTNVTLDQFATATVLSVAFNMGDTASSYVNFNGAIDAITLGTVTYDFELGVP